MIADVRRKVIAIKFFVQWIEGLDGVEKDELDKVKFNLFTMFFNSDSPNDLNIALLQVLPRFKLYSQHYAYVKKLAIHSAPALKAQALYTLS